MPEAKGSLEAGAVERLCHSKFFKHTKVIHWCLFYTVLCRLDHGLITYGMSASKMPGIA